MVDFGMLSDTFQEQKPSKEEVKKESPPKKVAFKNLDEDKLILKTTTFLGEVSFELSK